MAGVEMRRQNDLTHCWSKADVYPSTMTGMRALNYALIEFNARADDEFHNILRCAELGG